MAIRNAFDSGWSGIPDSHQRKILGEYNLRFESTGKGEHPKFVYKNNPKLKMTVSSTPSDRNAGKSLRRAFIRFIKKTRKFSSRKNLQRDV